MAEQSVNSPWTSSERGGGKGVATGSSVAVSIESKGEFVRGECGEEDRMLTAAHGHVSKDSRQWGSFRKFVSLELTE